MFTSSILVLLATAGLLEAGPVNEVRHLHALVHKRATAVSIGTTDTSLSANAIQSGSFVDGSTQIGAAEVGQAKSLTSQNNFINNCAGKTLTNGLQITTGSCNGITMGDIPAKTAMVSSIITFPLAGSATIQSDTTFNITVQMSNLVAGSFTNADATYYAAPQTLQNGQVVGHTHVTVQDMGASLNPTTALDATQFAFFKGINDAGNGQGLLSATVTGGLPAGNYRVCTMASASNHQPVLMPIAQRGTADDCTKFTVVGSGTTENVAADDGSKGQAAAALAASAVAAGPGAVVASSAAASGSAVASSSAASISTKAGKAASSVSKASTAAKAVNTVSSSVKASTSSKASTASISKATTSSKVGKVVATGALFSNTTIASTTTKAGKGGKAATSSTSVSLATETSAQGGKGKTVGSSGSTTTTTIVQKVIIIESFFSFILSLGGLPPSVSKSGTSFAVLEELFDDLASAASAACGQQFTTCISFSEPGFSFEECSTQKESCVSAASTATASSTPATLTATVTVPPSASVTGSVISESTLTTTVAISATSVAVAVQVTQAASITASTESICTPVTNTIFVDAPTVTGVVALETELPTCALVISTIFIDAPVATSTPIATLVFSNSTATSTSISASTVISSSSVAASTSTSTSSTAALGGIEAPAITNSGDTTRPFEVNGNTFVNKAAAVQRSCDVQFNLCADAVNGGTATGFTLADCSTQESACVAAGAS